VSAGELFLPALPFVKRIRDAIARRGLGSRLFAHREQREGVGLWMEGGMDLAGHRHDPRDRILHFCASLFRQQVVVENEARGRYQIESKDFDAARLACVASK
jgi:hypothetical protein